MPMSERINEDRLADKTAQRVHTAVRQANEPIHELLVQNNALLAGIDVKLGGVTSRLDEICLLYTSPSPRDS